MDWMNYFFPAAKPLAQAAQYGNTPPPQGNQDAGIDIAKAAQEQANRTLKAPAPSPVRPLTPAQPVPAAVPVVPATIKPPTR